MTGVNRILRVFRLLVHVLRVWSVATAIARSRAPVAVAGETDELVSFLVDRHAVGGARGHVPHQLLAVEKVVLSKESIQVVVSGVVARLVRMSVART